jgi:septal ring factor EnvC (AmiA/AmiB activator)
MTTSVLADERRFAAPLAVRRPSKRRTWMVALAFFALFSVALGYLVGNQVQVNTQFDQAHTSLHLTRHQTAVVVSDLADVRRDLSQLEAQVQTDTASLTSESTQLTGTRAALLQAQSTVSQQGSTINDLQSCLDGVEQSLNALSVGDQTMGLQELGSVSGVCQSVASASG